MRMLSPMTLIVVIALALCLIAGVAIILRSIRGRGTAQAAVCPHCGAPSRPPARYCSRCGADMKSQQA